MDGRRTEEWTGSRTTTSEAAPNAVHRLVVDHSERQSALVEAVRRSSWFDVQMDRLAAGDYLVNGEAIVERKTIRDLTASLLDGRLFPQVARLAHSPYRSLLLIEGPTPPSLPDVHPHTVEGALVSIATMWRIPVLHSSDPEQSARMLRFLAEQVRGPRERVLRRFDRKPNVWRRVGSSCCRRCRESGPRSRIGCCGTSVRSNGCSRWMPPRWPSARHRRTEGRAYPGARWRSVSVKLCPPGDLGPGEARERSYRVLP
jgi:hypothetical protein